MIKTKSTLLLFSLTISCHLWANPFVGLFAKRSPFTSLQAQIGHYTDQEENEFSLNQTLFQSEGHRWSVSGKKQDIHFDKQKELPHELEDIEAGLQFTRNLDPDRFWSIQTSYGSASDKTFEDSTVSTIGANFIFKASKKWLFLANYSNNRSFLNNIPIPSLMYAHTLTREKTLLIGIPFFFYKTPLTETLSLSYNTFLPYQHELSLGYRPSFLFQLSVGISQKVQTFLRYQRLRDDERLYLVRRKAFIRLKSSLSRALSIDLEAGHAFDQEYFEAESFSDSGPNPQQLKNGFYTTIGLKINI